MRCSIRKIIAVSVIETASSVQELLRQTIQCADAIDFDFIKVAKIQIFGPFQIYQLLYWVQL
jgi:hypothetical protein